MKKVLITTKNDRLKKLITELQPFGGKAYADGVIENFLSHVDGLSISMTPTLAAFLKQVYKETSDRVALARAEGWGHLVSQYEQRFGDLTWNCGVTLHMGTSDYDCNNVHVVLSHSVGGFYGGLLVGFENHQEESYWFDATRIILEEFVRTTTVN